MRILRRPEDSGENRDVELAVGVVSIPLFLVAVVGLIFLPESWHPRCWLNSTFAIPCPACGSFRALQLLCHGDFCAAFRQQPFVIITGLTAIAYTVYSCFVVFGRVAPIRFPRVTRMQRWLVVGAFILFVAVDWIYVLLRSRC